MERLAGFFQRTGFDLAAWDTFAQLFRSASGKAIVYGEQSRWTEKAIRRRVRRLDPICPTAPVPPAESLTRPDARVLRGLVSARLWRGRRTPASGRGCSGKRSRFPRRSKGHQAHSQPRTITAQRLYGVPAALPCPPTARAVRTPWTSGFDSIFGTLLTWSQPVARPFCEGTVRRAWWMQGFDFLALGLRRLVGAFIGRL